MRNDRIRILVEIGLTVALAAVLNLVKIWRMPNGGAISLEMLPLIVLALRRGVGPGMIAGAMYGVVELMFDAYVVNWLQFLIDYPVAYALVGIAGIGSASWRRAATKGSATKATVVALGWTAAGGIGRFYAHWVSGLVFFAQYAPKGTPVAIYSAVYNASYMVPSLAAVGAAAVLVLPALERAVPVSASAS
ncbi:MAG: energy-coupled thiamine transporter ThiT [Coriobacteriia bacterium]